MSEISDTQREDLKVFAQSINGSEASYGAIILRLMEENEKLRRPCSADAMDVVVDTLNSATELADQRFKSMEELSEAISQLRREKDGAYSERDMLVCAFAKLAVTLGWDAWLGAHQGATNEDSSITDWDQEWQTVVYIDTPHGQASWHVHSSEVEWFAFLPRRETLGWDGHTSVEKYARLGSIDVDVLRDGMRSFIAQIAQHKTGDGHLRDLVTAFVLKQSDLGAHDFAAVEFDALEKALGLREIVPEAVTQERLHQEVDSALPSDEEMQATQERLNEEQRQIED